MKGKLKYIIMALVLLVGIFGVSYAFYEFYDIGANNQLIVGNIYLKLNDGTDTVNLTNIFPETVDEARARKDNQVTFTVSGLNTTTDNDIYYEVMLNEGDSIDGKTRAKAENLVFDLIEIDENGNEIMIVDAQSFEDINARRVWVNTVSHDVTTEIKRTYKLRVWLSEDVLISDSNPNADYTTSVFANSYASVKVSVFGNFIEKVTDATCFMYDVGYSGVDYVYENYVYVNFDTSTENVNTCMDYMLNEFAGGTDFSDAQDGFQSFCEGTGSADGLTLKQVISGGFFSEEQIQSLMVVEDYGHKTAYFGINTSDDGVASCMNYMLDDYFGGSDMSDEQDGYKSFCEGTGIVQELTFGQVLEMGFFDDNVDDFIARNILIEMDTKNLVSEVKITSYDETCENIVRIPEQINGLNVTGIANDAFYYTDVINIKLPSTINSIGSYAFGPSLKKIEYLGTCQQLNSYVDIFDTIPQVIITSDSNSCVYNLGS